MRNTSTPQLATGQKVCIYPNFELEPAKKEQTGVHGYIEVIDDRIELAMNSQAERLKTK